MSFLDWTKADWYSLIDSYISYVGYGILIIGGLYYLWIKRQEKKIYTFKVRAESVRKNGQTIEKNFRGGYTKNRDGTPIFKVSMSRFKPWKTVELPEPDPAYIDAEERVYYVRPNPNDWFQARKIVTHDSIIIETIPTDRKQTVINELRATARTLNYQAKDIFKFFVYGLIGLGIIFVLGYWLFTSRGAPLG